MRGGLSNAGKAVRTKNKMASYSEFLLSVYNKLGGTTYPGCISVSLIKGEKILIAFFKAVSRIATFFDVATPLPKRFVQTACCALPRQAT